MPVGAAGVTAPGSTTDPNLSGALWWRNNQAKYANSADVADLAEPFRSKLKEFIKVLTDAGATVYVDATLRHPIRAYLMRYSWDISKDLIKPVNVPVKAGCPIIWDHGDDQVSRAAAREMLSLFHIVYRPSLTSRHIQGLAVDMQIVWTGSISIKNKSGVSFILGVPQSGATNTTLHAIGATYGVHKLLSDAPHWSSDGH